MRSAVSGPGHAINMTTRSLTDLENRILDFAEQRRPLHEARIEFAWRPATYVQRLFAVLDDPRAERQRPMLVRRLRRLRKQKAAARASRSFESPEAAGY